MPAAASVRRRNTTFRRSTPLLIGRAAELAAVKGLLLDPGVRLMTLTGPGGTGKTRLAMQVAADLALVFEGGVAFVNLAPLTDPGWWRLPSRGAVGVRESADQPLDDRVVRAPAQPGPHAAVDGQLRAGLRCRRARRASSSTPARRSRFS